MNLGLSFNLSLTDSQRRARDAVPLPYEHQGQNDSTSDRLHATVASISYIPDAEDDMDSDDPDDD